MVGRTHDVAQPIHGLHHARPELKLLWTRRLLAGESERGGASLGFEGLRLKVKTPATIFYFLPPDTSERVEHGRKIEWRPEPAKQYAHLGLFRCARD